MRLTRKIGTFGARVALLAGAGVAMRLLALPPLLPDLDSVNFSRALHGFDLASQAPHFPGYPVYVLLARAAAFFGLPDVVALSLPGILLLPAAVAALAFSVRRQVGEIPALGAGAIVALAPLAVLFGGAPSSDGLGFAALVIAVASAIGLLPAGEAGSGDGVGSPGHAALGADAGLHAGTEVVAGAGGTEVFAGAGGAEVFAGAGGTDALAGTGGAAGRKLLAGADRDQALAGSRLLLPWVVAGSAAGLMLGARPSYLPAVLLLPFLFHWKGAFAWIGGAALGAMAWLLPMVWLTGAGTFGRIAAGFLVGHTGEWGGTVVVAPDLTHRLSLFAFDVGAAGLGLPWPGAVTPARLLMLALVLVGSGALLLNPRHPTLGKAALLSAVPYAAWAFVGQNLLKSRHALPLLVAMSLFAAIALAGATRESFRNAGAAALIGCLAAISLPLALAQGREASPATRLVYEVAQTYRPEGRMVFTGEEARLFERYAPWVRAGRAGGAEELATAAERLAASGVDVLITSAAPGADQLSRQLEPLARFETDRLVRSHANEIVLYRFRPALAAARSAQ